MTKIQFISGPKEELPAKYLDELMVLMRKNRLEIFPNTPPLSLQYFRNYWTITFSSNVKYIFTLAIEGEKLLGYGYLTWNVKYDNLETAYFWCHVKKERRREGIGTKIVKELMKYLPKQIVNIHNEAFEGTDGAKFIAKLNPKIAYKEVYSTSILTSFDKEKIKQEAKAEKRKAMDKGYKLIFIDQLDYPFHLDLKQYVKNLEAIWNDMPTEELSFEKEILTIDRFLESLQRYVLLGEHIYTFVAIHEKTNEPVGMTCSQISKHQPKLAYQMDTGVIREHRGNGLGYALKIQMLNKLLQETEVTHWRTENAGSNEHMLKINRKLKYIPTEKANWYETTKEELFKRLGI